jgi:hypothetical protein
MVVDHLIALFLVGMNGFEPVTKTVEHPEIKKGKSGVTVFPLLCTPYGNRTRVSSVKGMRPNP